MTDRGRREARLFPVEGQRSLGPLIAEGLIQVPAGRRRSRPLRRSTAEGAVSDLAAGQRR